MRQKIDSNWLIDFSECEEDQTHDYAGSDRKTGIIYNGEPYMIKFSEKNSTPLDIGTSYVNNTISEYIGSHIMKSIGLPVHETLLGVLNGELVVACKNFTSLGDTLHEFSWYMRKHYDSGDIRKLPKYEQIYDVIKIDKALRPIADSAIARYWDTFVVDALIANFDRHKGNWGYIYNAFTGKTRLAPVYDCGSTMFPQLSSDGMEEVLQNKKEVARRTLLFPSAAMLLSGVKPSYRDMLSSGFDHYCDEALLRMAPKIDIEKIDRIIESIPILDDAHVSFYETILKTRKRENIDYSFHLRTQGAVDTDALARLKGGQPYDEKLFEKEMEGREFIV